MVINTNNTDTEGKMDKATLKRRIDQLESDGRITFGASGQVTKGNLAAALGAVIGHTIEVTYNLMFDGGERTVQARPIWIDGELIGYLAEWNVTYRRGNEYAALIDNRCHQRFTNKTRAINDCIIAAAVL